MKWKQLIKKCNSGSINNGNKSKDNDNNTNNNDYDRGIRDAEY